MNPNNNDMTPKNSENEIGIIKTLKKLKKIECEDIGKAKLFNPNIEEDLELLHSIIDDIRIRLNSYIRKQKYRSNPSIFLKEKHYKQTYNKNNRNKQRKWSITYRSKHKDTVSIHKKQYYKDNKSTIHRANALKIYGITIEKYNEIFNKQNGKCAICGIHQSMFKKNLHVDHCHITKSIRGLLCQKCNMAIGLFNDNTNLLDKAKYYLTTEINENFNI